MKDELRVGRFMRGDAESVAWTTIQENTSAIKRDTSIATQCY